MNISQLEDKMRNEFGKDLGGVEVKRVSDRVKKEIEKIKKEQGI